MFRVRAARHGVGKSCQAERQLADGPRLRAACLLEARIAAPFGVVKGKPEAITSTVAYVGGVQVFEDLPGEFHVCYSRPAALDRFPRLGGSLD